MSRTKRRQLVRITSAAVAAIVFLTLGTPYTARAHAPVVVVQ